MSTTENTENETVKNAWQPCDALRSEPRHCLVCEIVLPELQEEIQRLKNKIKKLKA